MEQYLPHIFVLNIFLTFTDATIGYHAAPTLSQIGAGDDVNAEWAIRGVRTLLAAVVAIYMFFNCLVFFDPRPLLLISVTLVIICDIVAQVVLSLKIKKHKEQ